MMMTSAAVFGRALLPSIERSYHEFVSSSVTRDVASAAPAFSLPGTDDKTHKLSDYKGKTVVLAWFPAAFTGG